ncbi:hypothetical protein EXT47_17060 [Pseudoalteromonas sp. CO342X]|uniref:hypothetical protein n=1 Tax=Pseudoalteromonas sp. CO342X TaxID=1777270 RepID=UPI001023BF0B|nr:hypothetical protein [Pseudoalteromonas sp. CO342X]RZG13375.1 hypothetical protein EXT47_17060 [Pseudoalteromonas sp. CO342X]
MIKSKLLIAASLLFTGISSNANAVNVDGGSGYYRGIPVGYHYTELRADEQGTNSAAIIFSAEARRGSCDNRSTSGLAHAEAVLWLYTLCGGRNTSQALHGASVRGRQLNLGYTFVTKNY